jgi:hypothetical protein
MLDLQHSRYEERDICVLSRYQSCDPLHRAGIGAGSRRSDPPELVEGWPTVCPFAIGKLRRLL